MGLCLCECILCLYMPVCSEVDCIEFVRLKNKETYNLFISRLLFISIMIKIRLTMQRLVRLEKKVFFPGKI